MNEAHIYARISHDDDGDEHGVTSQRAQCLDYAEKRGYTLKGEYVDNDLSAYSGVTRPEFERLLSDMHAGRVKHLIVWHVDRLCRRVSDLVRVIEAAHAGNTEIHTIKAGEIDLTNASGELMAHMLGAVAQFEARHLSERQTASQQDRVKRGLWRGGPPPYGYTLKGKGVLEINEEEAKWIRTWADGIEQGTTLFTLVKRTRRTVADQPDHILNKLALSSLKSRLLNPAVAGMVRYRGEIVGTGSWEPIITPDRWFAIHKTLTAPERRTNQGSARKWQGSGVYKCGKCGRTCRTSMSTRQAARRRNYACYDDCVSVSQKDLDEIVDHIIFGYFNKPENRLAAMKRDEKTGRQAVDLETERQRLEGKKNHLADMYMDGLIDEEQLSSATAKFKAEIRDLEAKIAQARSESPVIEMLLGEDDVKASWEIMSADNRAQIIDLLMEVTIMPAARGRRQTVAERVEIKWR